MIVEAIRLLVTLATTAVGFIVGSSWNGWFPNAQLGSDTEVVGALIGAGVGYVLGGVLGRMIRRGLDAPPQMLARASGPELFAGGFGLLFQMADGSIVLLTGCCHAGVVNTLRHSQQMLGFSKMGGLIGGLHLHDASRARLDFTVEELRMLEIGQIAACHCTGPRGIHGFR